MCLALSIYSSIAENSIKQCLLEIRQPLLKSVTYKCYREHTKFERSTTSQTALSDNNVYE